MVKKSAEDSAHKPESDAMLNAKRLAKEHKREKRTAADAKEEFLRALVAVRYPLNKDGLWTEDVTNSELVNQLELDNPMQLKRLINKARESGYVKLSFGNIPPSQKNDPLRDMLVLASVPSEPDYKQLLPKIGQLAAREFDRIYTEEHPKRFAIGAGASMRQFVNHMEKRSRSLVITPTNLAIRTPVAEVYDSSYLAAVVHWNCPELSTAYTCSLPPFPEDPGNPKAAQKDAAEMHMDLMKRNKTVRDVFKQSMSPDVAFLGAVHFHENSQTLDRVYKKVGLTYDKIAEFGAIGDMNFCLFDSEGNDLTPAIAEKHLGIKTPSEHPCHPFIAGLSLAHFKGLVQAGKKVILVCGGDHKVPVMKALIKGKVINGIITDDGSLARLRAELSE